MARWIDQLTDPDHGTPIDDDLAYLLRARAQFVECVRRTDAMIARQLMQRLQERLDGDDAEAAD